MLIDRFLDWCELGPSWINLSNGALLILGTLFGIIIVVESVDRLRGGNGVFF